MHPSADRQAFDEAVRYLSSFTDFEQIMAVAPARCTFDLLRLERLLAELGNPHHDVPVVHITGTKGKTTTTWMTERILRFAGLRTFRFTSPHVETLHERLAMDGNSISNREFAALMADLRPTIERIRRERPEDLPSFFELMTVLGFLFAREQGAQASVIEVGLGGRLDATNVVDPQVCILTSVAMDHERILGSTLPAIAREKAGILKPGRPAIVGLPEEHPGLQVVLDRAAEIGAPLFRRHQDFEVLSVRKESSRATGPHLQADLRVQGQDFAEIRLRAGAPHQAWNAAMAILASSIVLDRQGLILTPDCARDALFDLQVPARAEWFPGSPPVLLDGAHTAESIEDLANLAEELSGNGPTIALLGLTRDRDPARVLRPIAEKMSNSILVPLPTPRAGMPIEQARLLKQHGLRVEATDSLVQGFGEALRQAGPDGLVVVAGSLYLAGALRHHLVSPAESPGAQ